MKPRGRVCCICGLKVGSVLTEIGWWVDEPSGATTVAWARGGGVPHPVSPRRPACHCVGVVVPWTSASSLVGRVGLVGGRAAKHGAAAPAAVLVHGDGGIGARGDVGIDGVAGEDGAAEAGDVEEGGHVLVLALEEVGDLGGDADLVLAAELEALRLVGDLHEEPDALFLGRGVGLDHVDEPVDLGGQGVDRGGEDGVELAQVGELAGDICGERVERLRVL